MDLALPIATLAVAQFLAVASPGPSLVVVAQTAMSASRRAALANALGFGLGTFVWAASAMFGLALLFELAPWLYVGLKTAGAMFLLYLAYRLWRGAGEPFEALATGARSTAFLPNVGLGLLTQLANPKVALFFGSVFIALLPPEPGPAVAALVLALVVAIEIVWYSAMAQAFSNARVRSSYAAFKGTADRVAGAFLALLGVGLLLDRR